MILKVLIDVLFTIYIGKLFQSSVILFNLIYIIVLNVP